MYKLNVNQSDYPIVRVLRYFILCVVLPSYGSAPPECRRTLFVQGLGGFLLPACRRNTISAKSKVLTEKISNILLHFSASVSLML